MVGKVMKPSLNVTRNSVSTGA